MRPRKERGGKTRRHSSSPTRDRPLGFGPTPSGPHPSRLPSPATSLLDREFATEEDGTGLEDLGFPPEYYFKNGDSSNSNPRSFPHSVKQQCWDKAEKIKGRDPDRWRRDALGNTVFRKLVGCPGCLCHDYDHIIPFSKGGKSSLENCQVYRLQLIDQRGTGWRYPKLISSRRARTVEFQGGTWISLNSQHMEMFAMGRTQAVVGFRNEGRKF